MNTVTATTSNLLLACSKLYSYKNSTPQLAISLGMFQYDIILRANSNMTRSIKRKPDIDGVDYYVVCNMTRSIKRKPDIDGVDYYVVCLFFRQLFFNVTRAG